MMASKDGSQRGDLVLKNGGENCKHVGIGMTSLHSAQCTVDDDALSHSSIQQ